MAGKSTMRSEPDSMPRPSGQGNSARKHAAEKSAKLNPAGTRTANGHT